MDSDLNGLLAQREQQEQNLNLIAEATGEVRQMSIVINDELRNQNQMLADVQNKMDTVQDKIQRNVEQMEKLTQSSEGPLLLICVVLTLILIGMVYWAL